MAGNRRGLHAYTVQEAQGASMGQAGSILVKGTVVCTNDVGDFVAIQFIEDTTFTSLTAQDNNFYPSDDGASLGIDSDAGGQSDSVIFPAGMTIYGRWTGFQLADGTVIAYVG